MRILSRYIFRQTAGALMLILVSLTGVTWIAVALRQLELMTTQGQDVLRFLAMTTLAIPSMILGETALSFLGLGLRPPITSWGVLLNEAQNINVVALYPWLMLPVLPVVIVVLAFNFLGDGLRDAADPYK